MDLKLRKFTKFVDKTFIEGGKKAKEPVLLVSVAAVIEKIKELQQELNLQNLQVWSNFPGIKHEDCMRSIKLFTEEVIPNIKPIDTNIQRAS